MNESYTVNAIKSRFNKTILLSAVVFSIGIFEGLAQKSPVGKVSVKNERWSKGGFFEGFAPNQEILEKRSKTTKQFRNANGSTTVQIGGMIHYQDNAGAWQDIDYSIAKNTTSSDYKFSNVTNEFKSYFPEVAGSKAVKFSFDGSTLNWWKSPKMEFTSNGTTIQSYNINSQKGKAVKNSIKYDNAYPGITEEFEVIPGGLENNTIINSLTSEMLSLPANAKINFSQTIELHSGWKVNVNGKQQTTAFNAKSFTIGIPGFEDGLTFSPIFVYDNTLTKEQALVIVFSPKDKLTAEQRNQLANHIFQCDYKAEFTSEGLKITTILPVSWLKDAARSFPVTIDPIVTIGTTPGTGDFRSPISHWYGFQRHADLYLQSEIGSYGAISSIEYYKTGTQATRTKPTKVYFRDTPAATLTGTAAWNSATYIGGLTPSFDGTTTQDNVAGWKMITLTTNYIYASGNLLVMVYDNYGGGGSAQYFTETNVAGTQRQAYKRQDTTDPGDASATAVENYLPAIRITLSNPTSPTITSFTPSAACSGTGTVVITGTDLSSVTAVTIGGTPVTSFVINSATQITAIVGAGTTGNITVNSPFGNATSNSSLTINPSPVVAPIAGGAATVCVNGISPAFTNATSGGTWAIVNGTGTASIDNFSGIVMGSTTGTATVTYTYTDGTCSTTVSTPITIIGAPTAVSITGIVSPACYNTIHTLTAVGGAVNTTFVNQTFSGAGFPSGWVATAGAGDTVVVAATATAGGTANEVVMTGNSQTVNVTDRVAYGPINTSGLTSLNLQWNNYARHYSSTYAYSVKVQTSTDGITWHDSSWGTSPVTANIGPGVQNATLSTTDVGSATLYIAFTMNGLTFGAYSWSIDNVMVSGLAPASITWSPTTGLYTDAGATVPYTGTATTMVYAKPTTIQAYTVTATNAGGCTSTGSAQIDVLPETLAPTGNSPQDFTTGQTVADLVASGTGLLWYSDVNGTQSIPTSTPLADGVTYYVTQTLNGCPSVTLPIVAHLVLANTTFDSTSIVVFPNPVKNVLNISNTEIITKIQVVNLLGQEVMTKSVNETQNQLDMSNLPTGSYLVKVSTENQIKTVKVIKE